MCRLIMRVCLMGLGAGRGCLGCRYGGWTWRPGEWRGYIAATRLLSGYLADTWAFDRCPAGRFIHGNQTNVTTTNPSLPIPSHPIPSHPLLSLSHQPPSALIHYTHKSSPPPSFPLLELTPSLTWYTQQTRPIGGIWLWRRGRGKKERGEGDVVVDRCMCRCRYRYI